MRALIVVVFLLVLVVALVIDLSGETFEQDGSVSVKSAQQWGTVAPPYVIDSAAVAPPVVARARTAPSKRKALRAAGVHPCGPEFDLPPCYVMLRESGGDINAYNPTGCGGRGCRGKWQCDPRSCSGTGTEAQQDAEARALWNHGAGCAHWSACG